MKQILLSIFTLSAFLLSAQTFVSTTPENKNIILEEFTGISCGYCPDGHLVAQGIHDNHPNDFAVIAIHAGSFSSPQGAGTDFRTTFGTAIDGYFAPSGYPNGTVNRVGGSMGRGSWAGAGNTILSQSSPVNVGVQASVDMATNVLTVDVEVYYTGSQTIGSNKLSIAVVQNNVEGPQSGSSGNPSQMLPNGNYNHQHMLRHMMTGTWGEEISNISVGALYTNQYTWAMPADINGVALDPTNLGVVAFVSEDNEGILNGTTEISPSIIFANSYDAYCMSSNANNAICGTTTDLDVTFRNYGNQDLTSLDINYSINGGTSLTYPWTGNLAPGATADITIQGVSFTPQTLNNVSITTTNPNGNADQNTANDNTSGSFYHYNSAGSVQGGFLGGLATINVTTDQYGSETSWELISDNGTIVASAAGGSMSASAMQPTVYASLNSNDCYSFIIYDAYGDGICCQYGNGSYTVTDAAGTVIASGGNFTSEEGTHFETNGGSSTDINETISNLSVYPNPAANQLSITGDWKTVDVYDVFGKSALKFSYTKDPIDISSLSNGIYILNINTENKIQTQKITITK